jgi:hypothetical protein
MQVETQEKYFVTIVLKKLVILGKKKKKNLIAKILEISFSILLWKYLGNNGPWLLK